MATTTIPSGPEASTALAAFNGGNQTFNNTLIVTGWISEPSVRGTWSLIYSCLFTIGLCVYTAIHPNIPRPGQSAWWQRLRKLKWVGVTLLAPECALASALLQFSRALQLRRHLNRAGGHGRMYELSYCYYVVMGGFVVDITGIHPKVTGFVTLTHHAAMKIKDAGKIKTMEISAEAIEDKSKADLLAKGLSICQISWVVVQSLARVHARLPLTLLEIHTIVHIVSAVVMYVCWWCKPKDVNSTTEIDPLAIEDELRDMLARYHDDAPLAPRDEYKEEYFYSRTANFALQQAPSGFTTEEAIGLFGPVPLAIIYACVHMLASSQWGAKWHYFPTVIEAKLWDGACYAIIAGAVGWVIVAPIYDRIETHYPDTTAGAWLFASYIFVAGLLAGVGRLYVLVESLISLRSVPLACYTIPSWTLYLPHL